MTPLSFTSVERHFGYGPKRSLAPEPFAELVAPLKPQVVQAQPIEPPAPRQAQVSVEPAVPSPEPAPVREMPADQPATALPAYDERTDPNVTAVLLPAVTNAEAEHVYRRQSDGKPALSPEPELPIIETESVRAALSSAPNEVSP